MMLRDWRVAVQEEVGVGLEQPRREAGEVVSSRCSLNGTCASLRKWYLK